MPNALNPFQRSPFKYATAIAVTSLSLAAPLALADQETKTQDPPKPNSLVERLKQAQEVKRKRDLAILRQRQAEIQNQARNQQRKLQIDSILGDSANAPAKSSAPTPPPVPPKAKVPTLTTPANSTTLVKPKVVLPPAKPIRTHIIKEGETFSTLALKYYNTKDKWTVIGQANPLIDPTKLKIGQSIRVPQLNTHIADRAANIQRIDQVIHPAAPAKPAIPLSTKTVTTREGDTLGEISDRFYGTSKRWQDIYEANKDKLKSPDHIPVGIKLLMPKAK